MSISPLFSTSMVMVVSKLPSEIASPQMSSPTASFIMMADASSGLALDDPASLPSTPSLVRRTSLDEHRLFIEHQEKLQRQHSNGHQQHRSPQIPQAHTGYFIALLCGVCVCVCVCVFLLSLSLSLLCVCVLWRILVSGRGESISVRMTRPIGMFSIFCLLSDLQAHLIVGVSH